jgi:hypothetical protein
MRITEKGKNMLSAALTMLYSVACEGGHIERMIQI